MKHLKELKLNEESVLKGEPSDGNYLNNGIEECPSCGSVKLERKTEPYNQATGKEFTDYHCNLCGFDWYMVYELQLEGVYSGGNHEEIYTGSPIDKDSYNVE